MTHSAQARGASENIEHTTPAMSSESSSRRAAFSGHANTSQMTAEEDGVAFSSDSRRRWCSWSLLLVPSGQVVSNQIALVGIHIDHGGDGV